MFRPLSGFIRGATRLNFVAVIAVVSVIAMGTAGSAQGVGKWGGAIDADALQILKSMTTYLGEIEEFGVHTENSYEDVLETGQKFQFHFSSSVVVQRPNKLIAQRSDGEASRFFIYDGEKLGVYQGEENVYATITAPDNLDDFLHFARDVLGLTPPAGDMMFSDAFELLTSSITSAIVVGKAVIDGVPCNHLAFSTAYVDWQVWVAEGDKPLPCKYVLTTRDDPAQPQFVTILSKWNTEPDITDDLFKFTPPATAMEVDFILIGE